MLNPTHSGTAQIPHGFPAAGPNHAPAQPAQPGPVQAAGGQPPHVSALPPNGPHPLQRQHASSASRGPLRPMTSPQPGRLVIGPRSTVLDTVGWNSKENLKELGTQLMLARDFHRWDPRLGPARVAGNPLTRLGVQGKPLSDQELAARHAKARTAALSLLDNTEREFHLAGTDAGQEIQRQRDLLADPDHELNAETFADMMKTVSEAVAAQLSRELAPSRAERTTSRMPMDCMAHLGHALRAAQGGANQAQVAFLRDLGSETMTRVLRHELDFGATRQWLADVRQRCEGQGLQELAGLADQLANAIPGPARPAAPGAPDPRIAQLRHHATQLHDNVYGRALESSLINHLVHNPPEGVKNSMMALSMHLGRELAGMPPAWQHWVAQSAQHWIKEEPRGWQGQSPALHAFVNAAPTDALAALRALLHAPKDTGADCLAIPFLTVKLSVLMAKGGAATWMEDANRNYGTVVGPAAARETNTIPNPNRIAPKAGITAHHQPITVATPPHEAAMHPGDRNRPKLELPSPELLKALEHGAPFVSGVSGSTNIVMHAVANMRQTSQVDAKDALLGTMMFLTHDGGHSMHEAMWVGNQLNQHLALDLGLPGGDRSQYVADYRGFIDSFPLDQGGDTLREAADMAWQQTLDQFGRTSHFSPQNPA